MSDKLQAPPAWLSQLRHEREQRNRNEEATQAGVLVGHRAAAKEKLCKMVVKEDFYLPKPPEEHKPAPEGADAMLKHILNELGEEFFSNDMKKDPAEKEKEDKRKYEELRLCATVSDRLLLILRTVVM